MNKKLLFAATMAAMLASCSSEDALQSSKNLPDTAGIENAVSFDAYTQRGITRSGDAGVMDNPALETKGFGVFGYYTDMNMYEPTATPNFMYNQQIVKSNGSWTYEPVKYWPNEYGNKAQSDDVDQVTFFAYAPYVANTPATGKVEDETVGITGFTRNTAQGDPIVKYIGSLDPTKSLDLCWGVCAEADKTWPIIQGGSQTMTAGQPWMNVQRPQKSLGQKVKFTFKHALAQLNVQIDADVNTKAHGEGSAVDANTKVFVRKVTFSGFAMKGALNLNNEVADKPTWIGYSTIDPIESEEYTIYDGMKDGKEGTGYVAGNEKVTGLNPSLIQTKKWSEQAATDGVQKDAKNLFNAASADASIYVIPTGDEMNITIEYDIETKSDNLAGTVSDNETAGLSIPNTITKTITLSDNTTKMILEAGKKYTIKLHLGMSQVEFDATVSDWTRTAEEGIAWLPENGEGLAPVEPSIPATGISLDQTELNMTVGDPDVTLNATVTPDDATDKSVRWTSSDPTVATVDANGNVHAVGEGWCTIQAKNSANQVKYCEVIVNYTAATSIYIDDGSHYDEWYMGEARPIEWGYDDQLNNVLIGHFVAYVDPGTANPNPNWSSSDPDLVTVDQDGNVTVIGGIPVEKWGDEDVTVTITATDREDPTVKGTVDVNLSQLVSVGMFLGGDSKAYASKEAATAAGTTAVAWIAYTNGKHGLAIALDGGSGDYRTQRSQFNWSSSRYPGSEPDMIWDSCTWRWPTKADFENMLPGFKTLPDRNNGVTPNNSWETNSVYLSTTPESEFGIEYYCLRFNGDSSMIDYSTEGYVRAVCEF